VIIFKHFFDKLFSYLFCGLLPKKPRPYQSSCVTAALLGWLMVREHVLEKFNLCKSYEFFSTLPTGGCYSAGFLPIPNFQNRKFRAPSNAAFELLLWFKTINSIPHNLGTVTCVSFR